MHSSPLEPSSVAALGMIAMAGLAQATIDRERSARKPIRQAKQSPEALHPPERRPRAQPRFSQLSVVKDFRSKLGLLRESRSGKQT